MLRKIIISFKDWCFQVPHCQQVQPGRWPRGRHLPGQGDCVPDRDTLLAERWREHIRHGISYNILNFCCLRKYTAILTNLNNTYDLWMSRYASQLCPIPEVEEVQNRSSFHHLRPTRGKVLWLLCNSGVHWIGRSEIQSHFRHRTLMTGQINIRLGGFH